MDIRSEIADTKPLIQEISRLLNHNKQLEEELSQVKTELDRTRQQVGMKWRDEECAQMLDILKKTKLETNVFDDNKVLHTYSAYKLLLVFRDSLMTGVTSRVNISPHEAFLYFELCPRLAVHDLAILEKVTGVAWQRYRLSPQGAALLAFIDRQSLTHKENARHKSARKT